MGSNSTDSSSRRLPMWCVVDPCSGKTRLAALVNDCSSAPRPGHVVLVSAQPPSEGSTALFTDGHPVWPWVPILRVGINPPAMSLSSIASYDSDGPLLSDWTIDDVRAALKARPMPSAADVVKLLAAITGRPLLSPAVANALTSTPGHRSTHSRRLRRLTSVHRRQWLDLAWLARVAHVVGGHGLGFHGQRWTMDRIAASAACDVRTLRRRVLHLTGLAPLRIGKELAWEWTIAEFVRVRLQIDLTHRRGEASALGRTKNALS